MSESGIFVRNASLPSDFNSERHRQSMNKEFVELLLRKLRTGNLRSIHLNALPGRYATRLDATHLNVLDGNNDALNEKSTSDRFLFDHLLSQPQFEFAIDLTHFKLNNADEADIRRFGVLARRLSSIESENEDNVLEHGIQTFGLGYPLLVKRSASDPTKIIKAPLLIWNLDIKRSHQQVNQWIISRNEEQPAYLNEVLLSHLSSDEGIVLGDVISEVPENKIICIDDICTLVGALLERLGVDDFDKCGCRLQAANDKDTVERVTSQIPWIMWSGIFGLYRTQKQSIIRDMETLLKNFDDFDFASLQIERLRETNNSCVEVDPSQTEILNTLDLNEYKVIQGPPGTGKSQSLTAIISNMLENEGKVLVVCEKRTALEVIYNNLEKAKLHDLVAFVEDVNRDRKKLIDQVRLTSERVKYEYQGFNESFYNARSRELKRLKGDYDARNSNLNGKAFMGIRFRDLIAEYLKLKRAHKNDLFKSIKFKFKEKEFEELAEIIQEGMHLFKAVEVESFVFDLLRSDVFKESYSYEYEEAIVQKLQAENDFLKKFDPKILLIPPPFMDADILSSELVEEFDVEAFLNVKRLIREKYDYWNSVAVRLNEAKEFITSNSILGTNTIHEKIYSLNELFSDINMFRSFFQSQIRSLDELEQALEAIPSKQKQRPLKYHWSISFFRYFGKSNRAVSDFWNCLEEILGSQSELLDGSFNESKKNLSKFIQNLESVDLDVDRFCSAIEQCISQTENLRNYFQWRQFKEKLSKIPLACVSSLADSGKSCDWFDYFRYGYYEQLIKKLDIEIKHFNVDDVSLTRIRNLTKQFRPIQRHRILKTFEDKQFNAINEYNKKGNIKWLFNYKKNKKFSSKNSLRSIVYQEFELFTTLFPVLLLTPSAASSILPLKQNVFDVVIFDEASQLRLEETFPSVVRGKIKIISGDKHQMPPSSYFASDINLDVEDADETEIEDENQSLFEKDHPLFLAESESLLEFGNNNNPIIVNTSFLDFHYRSRHPYLIDFSNAAFYGSRLIPMPEKNKYTPIKVYQVNGTYESRSNQSEAEAIIRYIQEEYPCTASGTCPSLGIATFNIQQRNLIKELLYDRGYTDAKFRKKLEQIGEKEELFVKNLENIQGDERDIIILSTTFGPKSNGTFSQSFGPLNTGKGHRLLNVLVTRAKDRVVVFTSIPESVFSTGYQDALPTKGNQGRAVLYAYIDYCQAVSNGNEERRQEILRLLAESCEESINSLNLHLIESPFEQEVYEYLRPHIEQDRIAPQFKLGGFRVDFVILDEDRKPKIAIECDGARWHSSVNAWAYDLHRQRILEKQGLIVYRIWSKNWFPNPEKEALKVRRFIEDIEPSALRAL